METTISKLLALKGYLRNIFKMHQCYDAGMLMAIQGRHLVFKVKNK